MLRFPTRKWLCLVAVARPDDREALADEFRALNLQVVEAESGLAALCFCTKRLPHLIVADWDMIGRDGYSLMARLRPFAGSGPRVLAWTQADLRQATAALSTGADDYLAPPLNRTVVAGKIATLLPLAP